MDPVFFAEQDDFRKWLMDNHQEQSELLVGFFKAGSGKQRMTWPQSVDVALCFGWIDGVRKSIDKDRYQIRFTKRRSGSIWSAVNIRKMAELVQKGLMQPAGLAAFEKRKEEKSKIYAYEKEATALPPEFEKHFKSNKRAWTYFENLAPSYRKTSINWVMSAKQETTRLKRLGKLIADCEAGTNQWKDNKYNRR